MIQTFNINKKYKNKVVLNDVSISVANGEICGLMGINGAGKSTLMKIITNLVKADSGYVLIDNKPNVDNKNIGAMIESPCFYPHLNAKDNLMTFAQFYPNLCKSDIEVVLKKVGLDNVSQKFKQYSMGMKQRLYFAFAIMSKPNNLILDEPFSGIDPISCLILTKLVEQLAKEGTSVLICSHSALHINEFCGSVYILDKSTIVYHSNDVKNLDINSILWKIIEPTVSVQ